MIIRTLGETGQILDENKPLSVSDTEKEKKEKEASEIAAFENFYERYCERFGRCL